jgi:D-proline reductase (dithiol) PrdB
VTDSIDPAHRIFVSYIDKSREYYSAQGFANPYRWASNNDAPFRPLAKPLSQSRVAIVTTALPTADDQPSDAAPYAFPAFPPPKLFTMQRSWDKEATHTDDLDSFAPINRLREAAERGRIGSDAPRLYGIPNEYSQRKTIESDAPALLRLLQEDSVDVALLVPL